MPEQPSSMRVTINPGISRRRFSPGVPTLQRPQSAGRMIAQGGVDRLQIELQLAGGVHVPEVGAGLGGVLGDQAGVVVVHQVGILADQAQGGGRLGGHDVVALPDGVGQHGHVVLRQAAARSPRPRRRSPACPPASAPAGRRPPRRCAPARPPGRGPIADRSSWRRRRRSRAPSGRCAAWAGSDGGGPRAAGSSAARPAAVSAPAQSPGSSPAANASGGCAAPNWPVMLNREPSRASRSSRAMAQSENAQPVGRHVGPFPLGHQLAGCRPRPDIPPRTCGS